MVKKCSALPLIVMSLVLAGCEYFNAPLNLFIEMNTAKVVLNAVDIGV